MGKDSRKLHTYKTRAGSVTMTTDKRPTWDTARGAGPPVICKSQSSGNGCENERVNVARPPIALLSSQPCECERKYWRARMGDGSRTRGELLAGRIN